MLKVAFFFWENWSKLKMWNVCIAKEQRCYIHYITSLSHNIYNVNKYLIRNSPDNCRSLHTEIYFCFLHCSWELPCIITMLVRKISEQEADEMEGAATVFKVQTYMSSGQEQHSKVTSSKQLTNCQWLTDWTTYKNKFIYHKQKYPFFICDMIAFLVKITI